MAGDHNFKIYLDGDEETLARARTKAWEAIKSAMNEDPEFDGLVFAQFAHELLDDDVGFTISVISQLRRIAAQTIAWISTQSELSAAELAEWLRQQDEERHAGL